MRGVEPGCGEEMEQQKTNIAIPPLVLTGTNFPLNSRRACRSFAEKSLRFRETYTMNLISLFEAQWAVPSPL